MNKKECIGYDYCIKYAGVKDLHCEDCEHYFNPDVIDYMLDKEWERKMGLR